MLSSKEAGILYGITRQEFDTAVRGGRAPQPDSVDKRGRRHWRLVTLLGFEYQPAGPPGFQPGHNERLPKLTPHGARRYPRMAGANLSNPRRVGFFGGLGT